ncbi:MAG: hypothetical protein ABIJ30_07835 [bacterium]
MAEVIAPLAQKGVGAMPRACPLSLDFIVLGFPLTAERLLSIKHGEVPEWPIGAAC